MVRWEPLNPTNFATLAQLAEQLICNQQVEGSTPPGGFYMFSFLISVITSLIILTKKSCGADKY